MPRTALYFYGTFTLLLFLAQLIQPELLWQRDAINQGEWWRLWTGNIVHTDWMHLTLNTTGLWLFALLCGQTLSMRHVSLFIITSNTLVGILLYLTQAQLQWYAGLSGTLYGLFALGGVALILTGERLVGILLLTLLISKVLYDSLPRTIPLTDAMMQTPVIQEAHHFGLVSSILFIIPAIIRFRHHAKQNHSTTQAHTQQHTDT